MPLVNRLRRWRAARTAGVWETVHARVGTCVPRLTPRVSAVAGPLPAYFRGLGCFWPHFPSPSTPDQGGGDLIAAIPTVSVSHLALPAGAPSPRNGVIAWLQRSSPSLLPVCSPGFTRQTEPVFLDDSIIRNRVLRLIQA